MSPGSPISANRTCKLVMPNPEFEGIARQIKAALTKAGGESLAKAVYDDKVANGTAILTQIHHRADAALSDAGPRRRGRHVAIGGDLPGSRRVIRSRMSTSRTRKTAQRSTLARFSPALRIPTRPSCGSISSARQTA